MKKANIKSGKRTLGKLIVGVALTVLALSTPLAASAGSTQSGSTIDKTVQYVQQRVSWGGCGGCGQ